MKPFLPLPRRALAFLLGLSVLPCAQATTTTLADQPVFSIVQVPGNVLLDLSVEWPTADSVSTSGSYSSSSTYVGYFNPAECYDYDTTDTNAPYFVPVAAATNHTCSGHWSGNFLNWASMQTIDTFRWVMTGGNRDIDTSSQTILRKAYSDSHGNSGGDPDRQITGSAVSGATPLSWSEFDFHTFNAGYYMYFSGNNAPSGGANSGLDSSTPPGSGGGNAATAYTTGQSNSNTIYGVQIRVQVCKDSTTAESNCTAYPSNSVGKPTGLIQTYNTKIRFGALGYLNDSNQQRDAGVLRARMEFVGPTQTNPGAASTSNPNAEWDPNTGIFVTNPDTADAANTNTNSCSSSGGSVNCATASGVVNYLNKFGDTAHSYKSYDPISELFYAAVRYYSNSGNAAAWSDLTTTSDSSVRNTWVDGFPVIQTWDNPVKYSCQKNYILGIGDVNTHFDANLPGGASMKTGGEPTTPPEVAADPINVINLTNQVGSMETADANTANKPSYISGSLGTNRPGAVSGWCCSDGYNGGDNTFFMAGLAYYAHTTDLQPNFVNPDGSKKGSNKQISATTYWFDVDENQKFQAYNQKWLAAKYGGFTVPANYSNTGTTPLNLTDWYTSTRTQTDVGGNSEKLPDHYYPAGNAAAMQSGLTAAFADIASQGSEDTTAFSFVSPTLTSTNDTTYAASYEATHWTGSLSASSLSFDSSGNPQQGASAWNTLTILDGQNYNTGRVIATNKNTFTSGTSAGNGIAFRQASLTSSENTALGSTSAIQQVMVNFLRGDRSNEGTNNGNTYNFRTRTHVLGDIVNSRVVPVKAPNAPYSDGNNPGYSSFKSSKSGRNTMVYVGANDGMLHAVDGTIGNTTSGSELWAYVPSFLFNGPSSPATPAVNGLAALSNSNFIHHYYVDSTPAVSDVDFGNTATSTGGSPPTSYTPSWHTILVGGLGKGGKGYYALDVTSGDTITLESTLASDVLWEFTDTNMGYSFGTPILAKTKQYGWVVLVSSGYNNADGMGHLFVLNAKTGAKLQDITTSSSSAGMGPVTAFAVDLTNDTVDGAYVGDLGGNIWRFDLTAASGTYPSGTQLFTAANGNAQPITTAPLVEVDPETKKRYVLFGTGNLLDQSDIKNSSSNPQTYYAVIDGTNNAFSTVSSPITRSNLTAVSDVTKGIGSVPDGNLGWYYDLPVTTVTTDSPNTYIAARVTTSSTENFGIVAFAANLPSSLVCSPTGTSQVYALSLNQGKSVLVDTTNTITPYYQDTNANTNLQFVNVAGTIELLVGNDQGGLSAPSGTFNSATQPKILNWREVPPKY